MNRKQITALMALGVAVGCGGGGGGGRGGTAAPITGNGVIASALPVAQRDSAGYDFRSITLNSVKGAGYVTALGEAPTGTQSIVAHAPLNEVERQDALLTVTEDSFFDRVGSIASVPSAAGVTVYGATLSLTSNGAGDIFRRNQLSATTAQWSIALDTTSSESYVAVVTSAKQLLAFTGGEGEPGLVHGLNGGQLTQIASMNSAIGMKAVEYKNVVYIGAMTNSVGGGAAKLYRMLNGAIEEVVFPASAGGNGLRQEFVGMLSVAGVSSPSVAPTQSGSTAPVASPVAVDLLVVAVGSFDRNSRAGAGGQVLIHDGKDWETMLALNGEAPTSLQFIDNTLYVGTTGGKLLYRDVDGKWVEEPGLPANDGVTALLARDQATLLIGLRGKNGAQMLIRTAKGGGVSGAKTYYLPTVSSILAQRCTSCHTAPGMPAAVSVWSITAAANTDGDFTSTVAEGANLVTKGSGGAGHVGGNAFQGNEAQVVQQWITDGSLKQAPVAPPPPPPPPPATGLKYLTSIKPIIMARGCAATGCHNNPGRLLVLALANDNADWTSFRNQSNAANPAQSPVLLRPAGTLNHSPTFASFAPGGADYNTIVQWINDGRLFQ